MSQVVVHDQTGARPPVRSFVLEWNEGVPCTVRQLIAERVRYEHDKVHAPVEGLSANDIVNLPDPLRFGAMDVDQAIERALAAFTKNRFALFADGRQLADLDATIAIRPQTDVTFVRIIQLKGG